MSTSTQPVAYSYVRFSTPEQSKGDSLRRQTEAAQAWCERHKAQLDTSLSLRDLGKSAYTGEHRKNPDRHALAAFLKLAEDGKIPRGSYLIVENLDRLTREHVRAAVTLFLSILEHGVNIVTTKPERLFHCDSQDMTDVIIAVVELSRGHGESKRKSDMISAVWETWRKQLTKEKGKRTPGRLPAWMEIRGGKIELIPERAAAVARIYALAAAGYGLTRIVKQLEAEEVKPFGPAGRWVRGYVGKLLRDRRTVGEYQPRTGRSRISKPCGHVIPGFFPAVLGEDEWLAARAGMAERRDKPGRIGEHGVNLFAGLLFEARTGTPVYVTTSVGRRVLYSRAADEGRAPKHSFPLNVFEEAVLGCLREIDPHEILNGDHGPDETLGLSKQLAGVESRIADLEAELLKGDVAALAKVLRQLEAQRRELNERLQEARQKAANPLSETWGQAKTLLETLSSAPDPDEARLRLRSALRRMVDSVWMLVVPRGLNRLAAVQVWFAGGKRCRSYLIFHQPRKANASAKRPGQWRVWSLADVARPGDLDLRKPAHARKLETALAALDLEALPE